MERAVTNVCYILLKGNMKTLVGDSYETKYGAVNATFKMLDNKEYEFISYILIGVPLLRCQILKPPMLKRFHN